MRKHALTGMGTVHCSNSILVQPQLFTMPRQLLLDQSVVASASSLEVQPVKWKRSLQLQPEVLPDFMGTSKNPEPLPAPPAADLTPSGSKDKLAALTDFARMLSHACKNGDLSNIATTDTVSLHQDLHVHCTMYTGMHNCFCHVACLILGRKYFLKDFPCFEDYYLHFSSTDTCIMSSK